MMWKLTRFRMTLGAGLVLAALLLVGSVGYAAGRSGAKYSAPAVLASSGQITGAIICGEEEGGEPTAAAGISVWLKGFGYTAHTDDAGRFTMDYVPAGSYELAVITSGRKIRAEVPVTVASRTSVDVGVIEVTGGCEGCGGGGGGGGHDDGGDCEGEGEGG